MDERVTVEVSTVTQVGGNVAVGTAVDGRGRVSINMAGSFVSDDRTVTEVCVTGRVTVEDVAARGLATSSL